MAKKIKKNKIGRMQTFQKKTNLIFSQIAITAFVFIIIFFYTVASLYSQIILILRLTSDKMESICNCANRFSLLNYPYSLTMLFLSGSLLVFYLGYILLKFIKFKKTTNNFVKENLKKRKQNISKKLKRAIQYVGLENKVIEIKTKKPIVFCFSFFSSKICISSELVKRLNKQELRAVLLHEKMHLKNREPIKLFFVKNAEKMLFFLPGLKSLTKQYFVYSEIAADEFATNGFKNKSPLASALCKVMDLEKSLVFNKKSFMVPFFDTTDERINKLIDNKHNQNNKSTFVTFTINIFLLFFIAFTSFQIKSFNFDLLKSRSESPCLLRQDISKDNCMVEKSLNCSMKKGFGTDYSNGCYNQLFL